MQIFISFSAKSFTFYKKSINYLPETFIFIVTFTSSLVFSTQCKPACKLPTFIKTAYTKQNFTTSHIIILHPRSHKTHSHNIM